MNCFKGQIPLTWVKCLTWAWLNIPSAEDTTQWTRVLCDFSQHLSLGMSGRKLVSSL